MIEHHYMWREQLLLVLTLILKIVCVCVRERACSEVVVGKWD